MTAPTLETQRTTQMSNTNEQTTKQQLTSSFSNKPKWTKNYYNKHLKSMKEQFLEGLFPPDKDDNTDQSVIEQLNQFRTGISTLLKRGNISDELKSNKYYKKYLINPLQYVINNYDSGMSVLDKYMQTEIMLRLLYRDNTVIGKIKKQEFATKICKIIKILWKENEISNLLIQDKKIISRLIKNVVDFEEEEIGTGAYFNLLQTYHGDTTVAEYLEGKNS